MAEVCSVGLGGKRNHAPYPPKKKRQKTKFALYGFQSEMGRNRWIPDVSGPTRKKLHSLLDSQFSGLPNSPKIYRCDLNVLASRIW